MESDNILVEKTLACNDKHAFGCLMERHKPMVKNALVRYCKNENHSVEDLVQETFIRAYISLRNFRAESTFATWLYRIATNVFLDKFRRKKIDSVELDMDVVDSYAEVHHYDLRRDIAKALNNISESQKIAVQLCLQEGYSHADAARTMQIPLGTVKSHVARGKLQLQQFLGHWNHSYEC